MTETLARPPLKDGPIIPGTAVTYNFPDENGRLQLRKVRWQTDGGRGKTFRMQSRRPLTPEERKRARPKDEYGIWVKGSHLCPNAHELPYGLPGLIPAIDDGTQTVYWTEGEKDVDSLRAVDEVAVSHWQGACNATEEQARWVAKFTGNIVLVADADPPGAADVLQRFGLLLKLGIPEARIRIVRPHGGWYTGKDVTDHLEAGLNVFQLVPVRFHSREMRAAAKQFIEEREAQGGHGFAY